MKRTADFAWIVVFTLVAQLVLITPGPAAAMSSLPATVTQPALGLSDLVVSAPDTTAPFVLPAYFLFPMSGTLDGPASALDAASAPGGAGADTYMWSVPETLPGDSLVGSSTLTDESGRYRFVGLPKGTHKVTIDLATLPPSLRPAEGDESPVLWIHPGTEQVSRALSTGVRFTATYDRESGDVHGAVFVDLDSNGQFDAGEPGLAGVRVVDPTLHQYFVPFDDRNLWAMFEAKAACHGGNNRACAPLISKVFISAGADGTIYYYDHWEDGYDVDALNPGPTTEVGALDAGTTQIFESDILVNLIGQGPPYYHDGRDRITVFGDDASVVRLANASSFSINGVCPGGGGTNGWLAAAWEVPEVADWGKNYHAIVGEDLQYDFGVDAANDHDYSGLEVMAWKDGTTITYTTMNRVEVVVRDAGETYFVPGANGGPGGTGAQSTDDVVASDFVQVQMMTGACSTARVSAHGYTLMPQRSFGRAYWAPVPGFTQSCNPLNQNADTDIYVHNPDLTNGIQVTVNSGAMAATLSIPPATTLSVLNETGWPDLATGNQGTFLSSDGVFYGVVAVDSATNGSSGSDDYDWGYSLLADSKLSSQVILGYGPGRPDGRTDLVNGNVAFVVATSDTRVFIDLNQDGLPDPFDMDGDGQLNTLDAWGVPEWDEPLSALGVPVQAGQVLRIADPFDFELRGARIYTRALDEHIAVAWGQDPCTATYLDYLDLGYTVLASPVPRLAKSDGLAIDADSTGGYSPGDTITYTVVLRNNGMAAMSNVVLTDSLPYTYTDFVVGSLQVTTPPPNDGTQYFDGSSWGGTATPGAQQFRVTWPILGSQEAVTLTFRAYVRTDIPVDVTEMLNQAVVSSSDTEPITVEVRTPVQRPLLSMDKVATPAVVSPGGRITYTLVISNYGDGVALLTSITDVLPSWVEYVPGTLDLEWPTARTETVTEVVTRTTYYHGFYLDDFDLNGTGTTNYSGDDSSRSPLLSWTTDWTEINDDGNPGTGQVRVRMEGNALSQPANLWLGRPTADDSGVERTMNLAAFRRPVLRYYPSGAASNGVGDVYNVMVNGASLATEAYAGGYAIRELDLSPYAGQPAVTIGFIASAQMEDTDFYRFDHIAVYESDAERTGGETLISQVTVLDYRAVAGIDPVSYISDTGWMVITDGVRLPATGVITATFQVQTAIPLTDGLELVNTACVTSANWLTQLSPPCDTETVIVQADHVLELTKDVDPPAATVGGLLTYTLSYRIAGDEAVETMVVSDTTPVSTTFVSASPLPLSQPAVGATGAVVWQMPGLWPPGSGITEVSGTLTMTVRVGPGVISGTLIPNTAVITDSAGLTDTAVVTVPVSSYTDLEITKADDPDLVVREGVIEYTLVYTNHGPSDAVDVVVQDTLPPEVTYGGVVEQPAGWSDPPTVDIGPPATVTWFTPTLAAGASGRMVFTVTVNPGFVGTVTNTVVISTTTPESDYTNNRDIEPTEVLTDVADVTISKWDDVDPVQPGGRLVYTLVYTNNGPSPAANVVVTDTLPPEVTFVDAVPTPASSPDPLVWNLGSLDVGVTGTITVAVTVQSWVTQTFTNPVRIDTDTPESDDTNNDDEEPTSVPLADVTISKSDDVDPVQPGGRLVYTLVYTNNGPSPAANVVVTDVLPPEVEFVDAVPAEASGPDPFLLWNLDTLAVGQSGTITVAVNVRSWVTQTFTNTVRIDTDTPETDYTNNDDDEPTSVPFADVTISKSDDVDPAQPGGRLVYTLVYTNNGPSPAVNVVVTDVLPPEVEFVDAVPAEASGPDPFLLWNLDTLAVGQSGTITVAVNVRSWVTQTFTNTVRIDTSTPETDYANNDDDEPTQVFLIPLADVTISKSDDVDPVQPGGRLVYTLQYRNNGPSPAVNVVVSDTLPPEVTFVNAVPAPASGPNPLVWNRGTLAVGQSGTITVAVNVRSSVTQTFTNTVRIDTSTPETDYTNNDDLEPTSVPREADVWILKKASVSGASPGEEFVYTLEYGNDGSVPAANVVVSDTLPPELNFIAASPDPVSVSELPLLRWSLGTLDVGARGTIVLSVIVKPDVDASQILNTAVISTTTPETNYRNNRSSVPTSVQLLYFWAKPLVGSVLLEWATAWEIDTYGFYLLRSETGNLSDAVEVGFVSAKGRGQGGGAAYSYLDRTVEGGWAYSYWLVDVDTDGRRTVHGPVEVPPSFLWYSVPYPVVMSPRPYG